MESAFRNSSYGIKSVKFPVVWHMTGISGLRPFRWQLHPQPPSAVSTLWNLRVGEPATFPRVRPTRASLCRGGRGIQVSQGRVWHTSLWWAFFDIRGGKAETGSRMNRDRFDTPLYTPPGKQGWRERRPAKAPQP